MAESEEQRAALEKLDRLADEIDSLLYLKPESFRLSVAKKLVEARQTVTAAGLGWYAWTRTNIDRSQGEIRRLLEIGAAPDPQQALDRFREKARKGMHGRPRKGRPSANYKWISARLDKLSDDEVKRLIGVLVERLSVEDLARMLSGLPVIIRRKKDSLPG